MHSNKDNSSSEQQNVPSILAKRKLFPGDKVLGIIIIMFFALSIVVVPSAMSKVGFSEGSIYGAIQKHVVTICLSAGLMLICYLTGAKVMHRFTWILYVGSLIMTIVPYFQEPINGAHRWLNLGFIKFQPSELLKIATIMLLAARLSAKNYMIKKVHMLPTTIDVRKWWSDERERDIIHNEIIPIVSPIALTCMAIIPDATSSAFHIFITSLVLLIIAGMRVKEILKFFITASTIGLIAIFTIGRGDTVISRTESWLGIEQKDGKKKSEGIMDKYSDSQRAQMAIYNGNIFGVGAGRSVMRARLMHPESDYLFSIVFEEFGLFISFIIVLLYLWIFFRALRIFEKCEWLYAGLLVVGLALLVTSQGFLHIGVNIGLIPETGQNLPFLTQGRTGMFCASIALGLIMSISRQVEQGTLLPPSEQDKNRDI